MQNKPNLLNSQTNVSSVLTEDYENEWLCSREKNKPNQTQTNSKRSASRGLPFVAIAKKGHSHLSSQCHSRMSLAGIHFGRVGSCL